MSFLTRKGTHNIVRNGIYLGNKHLPLSSQLNRFSGTEGSFKNFGGVFSRSLKTPTIDWKPVHSSKTNLAKEEINEKNKGFRGFVFGLMIAMPVITLGLGCWQVSRLQWKTNLISKSENALAQPPMESIPANLDPSVIPEFEYRKFKVRGRFDHDQEMLLGPRMRDDMVGYLVICPFIRSDGGKPILVERGWIRKDMVLPERRMKGDLNYLSLPKGEIEIVAMFRIMPQKSYLQIDHEMGTRLFHIPDVEAMAKQSNSLPIFCQMLYDMGDHPEWGEQKRSKSDGILRKFFFRSHNSKAETNDSLEEEPNEFAEITFIQQGVPIGTRPTIKLSNNHFQYLITWFGLCIASTGLLVYSLFKSKKWRSAESIIEAKRNDMKKW